MYKCLLTVKDYGDYTEALTKNCVGEKLNKEDVQVVTIRKTCKNKLSVLGCLRRRKMKSGGT